MTKQKNVFPLLVIMEGETGAAKILASPNFISQFFVFALKLIFCQRCKALTSSAKKATNRASLTRTTC